MALGLVLVAFVLLPFAAGAIASVVIAQIEDPAIDWPSAWLIARAVGAGWLILAAWAAFACCSAS